MNKKYLKNICILSACAVLCLAGCSKQPRPAQETAALEENNISNSGSGDFFEAVKTQSPDAIKRFLKNGANVNAKQGGLTPLEAALRYNPDPEVVKILIGNKADTSIKDETGANLLIAYAPAFKSNLFVRYLIAAGLDPNSKDKTGRTPIISAAPINTDITVFMELISSGADINARTADGWSALDYAVRSNKNPEVIKVLLKYGARPKNKQNAAEINSIIKANPLLAGKGYEKMVNDSLMQ